MADNVIAIQVNVDGIESAISHFNSLAESFGKLAQGAQQGTSGNETLENSLNEVSETASEAGDNIKKLDESNKSASESTNKLSESSKKAEGNVEKLGKSTDEATGSLTRLEGSGSIVGELFQKIFGSKIVTSIGKIGKKFSGLLSPLKKIGEVGKNAFSFLGKGIGSKIGEISSKLKNLYNTISTASANGGGLGAIGGAVKGLAGLATGPVGATVVAVGALTAATAGFGAKALKASGEFQKGMNMVYTMLPNASQQTKDKLSKDVLDISEKYGKSANEISEAMYQALSAGVEQDKVRGFLEVAQKGATAGVTDITTAVDGLSSIVNAWGADAINAGQASDLIFTAVKNGKTSFGEIAGSIAQVSPIASALGVNFSDVSAAIGTLTAKGTPTSVVMTQMKAAFSEFSKGSTVASKEFKKATGQSFQEFIAKGGNLQTAMQALEKHANKTGKNINEFFGSVEAGSFALSLTGENTEAFTKNMQDMKNSKGATDKAFSTMNQGIGPSMERMKASIARGMIEAGKAMTPMASKVLQGIEGAFPAIGTAFSSIGQSFLPLIEGWASSIGGFFQTIQSNGSQFSAIFQGIGSILTVIFSGIGAAISVTGAIFNAIFGIIINLLGSFMSSAGLAGSQGQNFASTISGAFSAIASVVGGALQFIMPLLVGLAQIIGGVLGFAVRAITESFLFFGKIISKVGGFFKKLFGKDDAEQATAAINEVKKGMEELNSEAAKGAKKEVEINTKENFQQTVTQDFQQMLPDMKNVGMSFGEVKLDPNTKVPIDPTSFSNTQMKIDPTVFSNVHQAVQQVSSDIKSNPQDVTRNNLLGELKAEISVLKAEMSATKSAIVGKLSEVVSAIHAIKINVNVPATPSGDDIANRIAASLQKG